MYWLRLRQHALDSDLQTSVCWLNPRVVIRSDWGARPPYTLTVIQVLIWAVFSVSESRLGNH